MSTASSPSAIGQIAINAHDIPRAVAFYRDKLGLRLLFEVPPKMAFFDCGGVRLMLSLPEEAEYDHAGSILYYKVTDIREAYGEMQRKGVEFKHEPSMIAKMPDHELWMAFFKDSEGNTGALMSEVRDD
jgi:methylmalonyl-CoA/ethylmalonyl-CoA epimerase